MTELEAIQFLRSKIYNPNAGLPIEIFYFVSTLTPLANVDLLIKDSQNRTLLAWRDDKFAGTGWHIPGGIIRYKESFENRIQEVAKTEIGTHVSFDSNPIAINQIIADHEPRGHFISLLYNCKITDPKFDIQKQLIKEKEVGHLAWHATCPDNLIKFHDIYRIFI